MMHGIMESVPLVAASHWLSICVSIVVFYLIRNRYHNGLHKYPGPILASFTDLWRFYDVYKRRPEVTHQKLHEKYGTVVRLGPNCLSFSDPKALKTIYGLNKGFVKSDFYVVQQPIVKGHSQPSLFSTTDNDFHAQFRRCVNAAFSMSSLVQYEPFVDNTTALFLKQTERLFVQGSKACDLTQWLQFYAFDVIGEITYTRRHGFIEKNEDVEGIVAYLTKLFCYVAPIGQMPMLDYLFLKNPLYLRLSQMGFFDSTSPIAAFARSRLAERLSDMGHPNGPILPTKAEGIKSPDLLSKFLAAKEARPEFMTDTLVQTMAASMAFAGSETTAITLSAVFYYLLRNPSCMDKLRSELDEAGRQGLFGDYETGVVTWHESQKLKYLDACVKEAFRMHPAPGLPLERIVPQGGMEIAGHFIKAGTIVGVSAWVLHRNTDIFGEEPYEFRPERWLVQEKVAHTLEGQEKEEQRIKQMNGMMLQFGMGSRTCIGKNISLLEVYKLVPSLLRRFEIEFQDPSKEWKIVNAWFVKQSDFVAKFKLRELVLPESSTRT